MQTAEDVLKAAYAKIVKAQSSEHDVIDPLLIEAMKEYARRCVIEAIACAKEHTDCELDVEGAIANSLRILELK